MGSMRSARAVVSTIALVAACGRSDILGDSPIPAASGDGGALPDAGEPADAALPSPDVAEASVADVQHPSVDVKCPNAPGLQPGSPWPAWGRCPGHTRSTPVFGPNAATTFPQVGGMGSSEALVSADGTVYVLTSEAFPNVSLDAVRAGTTLWQTRLPVAQNFDRTQLMAGGIGADGTVFVSGGEYVDAVRPDGSIAWSAPMNSCGVSKTHADLETPASVGVAVGNDGTVYVPCLASPAAWLAALNPDGSVKWTLQNDEPDATTPAVGPDGTIYVVVLKLVGNGFGGDLVAIAPDGTVKWRDQALLTVQSTDMELTPPIVGDDGTIVVQDGSALYDVGPDGTVRWTVPIPLSGVSPAIGPDGTIFVSSLTNALEAVKPQGTIAWTFGPRSVNPGCRAHGGVIVAGGGNVYVGYYACGPDVQSAALASDGTVIWQADVTNGNAQPSAMNTEGVVYSTLFF
jgi:hypothetical protein